MKIEKFLTLSTAHLHPLEAKFIDEVSFLSSSYSNLICTDDIIPDECKKHGMVCLQELLKELKEKFQVDYVLFDPDAEKVENIKTYDW
jgi:hypothetical protein